MADPFIGEIVMFGGNFAPRGWALCDGQLLAISGNSALFSLLGTIYGGDGRTTFALPDLRGRVPMHAGNGPGLSPRFLGQKSGAEQAVLNSNQLPSHTHIATSTARAVGPAGNSNDAVGNLWADDAGPYTATYHTGAGATPDAMHPSAVQTAVGATGGGAPHSTLQPYQVVNFIIALVGTYPSRN